MTALQAWAVVGDGPEDIAVLYAASGAEARASQPQWPAPLVVRLDRDCGCQAHDGPHWLHVDVLDRLRTREMIEQCLKGQAFAGMIEYLPSWEIERLRQKRLHMLDLLRTIRECMA